MLGGGRLRADVERFGWLPSLFARVMRRLQKRLGVHVCRVRVRKLGGVPSPPSLPAGIDLRVLSRDDLLRASVDDTLSLSRDFVEAALERGDMAFGAYDGDQLVSYMWRTLTAAPHVDGLWVRADRPYCYGYKGFTHPDYRGLHLNPAVSLCSDEQFLTLGYTHNIGFIDVHNLSSLATRKYKGNVPIGYAGYVNWFGRCFTFRTPAVKRTGFEFFSPPR